MKEIKNIHELLELLYSVELEDIENACALIRSSIESGERDLAYYQQYIPNFSDLSILEKIYKSAGINFSMWWLRLDFKLSNAADKRAWDDLKYYTELDVEECLKDHYPLKNLLSNSRGVSFLKGATMTLSSSNSASPVLDTASLEVEPLYPAEINFIKQMANNDFKKIHKRINAVSVSYNAKCIINGDTKRWNLKNYKTILSLLNTCADIVDQLKQTPPKQVPLLINFNCNIFRDGQINYDRLQKMVLTDEMKVVLLGVIDRIITTIIACPTIQLYCRFEQAMLKPNNITIYNVQFRDVIVSTDYLKLYEQLQNEQTYNEKIVSQLNNGDINDKEKNIINYLKNELLNKMNELICY